MPADTLEEHNDLNYRRLLQDLDRSRQEVKLSKSAVDESERRLKDARKDFDVVNFELSDKLKQSQIEVAKLNQALTAANERSMELRGLLNEQQISNSTSLKEFKNIVLKISTSKRPAAKKK